MKKLLLLFVLLSVALTVPAQDTLWVKQKEGMPYIVHRVKSGETLFLLSKKYSVPPAVLADVNQVNYQEGLPTGSKFKIPVDDYNFIRIEGVVKSRPIFYKAGDDDDLRSISRMFRVSQSTIQRWNNSNTPEIEAGSALQVGWIAYDPAQRPFGARDTVVASVPAIKNVKPVVPAPAVKVLPKKIPDTTLPVVHKDLIDSIAEPSQFEQLYEQQVQGVAVNEESGAAVFYPLRTKAATGVYYAFHNTAIRGSILKIMNPANGKIIYAKVIGILPNLKEYHNSVVGLSSNAISALGATDRRMFCKLKYR